MPESKSRRRPTKGPAQTPSAKAQQPNPVWFTPVMVSLMIIGLLWIITFYISSAAYPVPNIGNWNIAIGFGIALIGFLMTTRWRS